MSRIELLKQQGQSIWLDYIRRGMLDRGELKDMIEQDGLSGLTSNPAIFQKAIGESEEYHEAMRSLADSALDANEIFEHLAVEDIQRAADFFRETYAEAEGHDGLVSFEVAPEHAFDADATISEARRLWRMLDRPNVMIKVPATEPGLKAIETLVGEGYNINVTLLFSRSMYERVAEVYLRGIERFVDEGGDPSRVASVASFFVSRVDNMVDQRLRSLIDATDDEACRDRLRGLLGQTAIANALMAYRKGLEIFSGPRWEALASLGARPQRLLWGSTSTKDPQYPDTLYVERLALPGTVNTVPPDTFDAWKDHGRIAIDPRETYAQAEQVLLAIAKVGIDLNEVTGALLVDGVRKFAEPFAQLLSTIAEIRGQLRVTG